MKVAVPREVHPGEQRVAIVPDGASKLAAQGFEILVQRGAGESAFFSDASYEQAGARLIDDLAQLAEQADIVVKVHPPSGEEADLLREGSALLSLLQPHQHLDLVRQLAGRRITAFSMDLVPRITKAQDMDALSSMSTLSGYKAVLLAAASLGKLLPMIVSAAGTLPPARVLILGAGVAGLQAIATARRLGAIAHAFDIRPATKEQVQSLGGRFIEMPLEDEAAEDKGGYARELSSDSQARALETIRKHIHDMDIVITTAQIPGKPAPRLITREMIAAMKPGSVVVDLAAETGGNCELTRAGEEVRENGVLILGPVNLPATMPVHASQMYSRNVSSFLRLIQKDGALSLDFDEPVTAAMCVTHEGAVRHEATRLLLEGGHDSN